MNKLKVYLVGAISEDKATHEWRIWATKRLKDKFDINDPAASKFDRETLKESGGDYEKMRKLVASHQAEILLPKSYQSIERADIILVNLALEPKHRPMIGTLMEIAWAYYAHKTIIAIRGDNYYSKHPMIVGCIHAWGDSVDEVVAILEEFFTSKELK